MTINGAVEAASRKFAEFGIDFNCPWDGDLSDLERERFEALKAALAAAYPELVAEIERLRKAAVSALTSMLIASKLPGVSDEYDFEPVIQEISAAINTMPRATLDTPKGDGR